jgi:hypothetical protein
MADNVSVIFSAQIGQLISGVDEVKQSIQSIASPIASITGALGSVGEAFATAFAVDKIDEFFSHFAELAVQTQRNASLLGVSVQSIGGLDILAKSAGGSIETLVMSMERLGLSLARAGAGSAQAVAGLQALGISAKQFQSLSPQAQIEELADKFSVLKDGIDKDAIAMAILGRGGAQMIPVFNQGAEAIRGFQEEAERTGTALSGPTTAAFKNTHSLLIELSKSFEGVGITIASALTPAFDGAVKAMIILNEGFTDSARAGGEVKTALEYLAAGLKRFEEETILGANSIQRLWEYTKTAVFAMGEAFWDLGRVIKDVFTFNFGDVTAAWKDLTDQVQARVQIMGNNMRQIEESTWAAMDAIHQKSADHEIQIAQTKHARLNILNKDSVNSALAAAQEQIRIVDMQYSQAAEKINSAFKQMQITESQKTQALLAALDLRHNAELAALDQEAAVQGLSKAQYQKVLNEKLQLDQKYAMDRQKILDKAAEDEAKTWKAGADQVAGAFNSQLKSLLAGQETFGQAMQKIAGDLVMKTIEYYDKLAIEWIANQLRMLVTGNAVKATDVATTVAAETAKTTANVAGNSARTAADTAAASTGILAQIGNAFAVITADAAKTFAGVFAFLAPALGPAAAGPATAAAATVEASAGAIAVPGLAVGTDYVLSPGLAFLHSGESVVPAQTSGPYSGGGQGGSQQINFNLSAFNPSGLQQLIRYMMPQLTREIGAYQQLNPSLNSP